jgi:Ca2+-binding EF-hand superfamily protein
MLPSLWFHVQDQGLSGDDISALIAEHDSNKDGVIDYQEFLAMMRWVAANRMRPCC